MFWKCDARVGHSDDTVGMLPPGSAARHRQLAGERAHRTHRPEEGREEGEMNR